ncbi:major facilitator superfamily domain-containing protein [Aspergillus nidulans var. acristatus]
MASDRSGYHQHHDRVRPSIEIDEILPADEAAITTTTSSSSCQCSSSALSNASLRATAFPAEGSAMPTLMPTTTMGPRRYSAFSNGQKRFIVAMVTLASFFSPLSGQIYYPVMPTLVENYHLSNALINLTITTYMILQGLAPAFMGTFADACGRRPAYVLSFVIYTAANISLALQNSYPALMVLRCIQSAGSSGTVSFGYGVISDIATPAERGSYVGPMAAGVMLAPALGPIIGGLLAKFLGWRSVFWFLAIGAGGYLVSYVLFVPETARTVVGDGSLLPRERWKWTAAQWLQRKWKSASGSRVNDDRGAHVEAATMQSAFNGSGQASVTSRLRFPNPVRALYILLEPDALIIVSSIGLLMLTNAALLTSTPSLFSKIYGFNDLQIGLCFLPLGIGAALGAVLNGYFLNRSYRRHAQSLDLPLDPSLATALQDFPIEQARLETYFPLIILTILTIVPYGFVLERRADLSAPLILQFLNGFATVACTNTLNTLLVDLFPDEPATAAAACNLIRCWLGALGAAVVDYMLSGMGWGWCFMFLGLLLLASIGLVWTEFVYGAKWRESRRLRRERECESGRETIEVAEGEEGDRRSGKG